MWKRISKQHNFIFFTAKTQRRKELIMKYTYLSVHRAAAVIYMNYFQNLFPTTHQPKYAHRT